MTRFHRNHLGSYTYAMKLKNPKECFLIMLAFQCFIKFNCAVDVSEKFDIRINYEDFECNKIDPYARYYDYDYKPKEPCTVEDFIPCQADFVNSSLNSENIFPSYIYCASKKAVTKCNEEVFLTCQEPEDSGISTTIKELNQLMFFMEQNCLCNTTDHYSECADPCKAQPCLNGGTCVLTEMESKIDDGYYYYYTKKEFKECHCPTPYSGKFCQKCDTCTDTCKKTSDCACPNNFAGPFCNIACSDVEGERVNLYRSCVQVAFDLYFLYPQPSGCVVSFVIYDCVAASLNQCGIDRASGLKEYHILETYRRLSERLLAQRCIVYGTPPFTV